MCGATRSSGHAERLGGVLACRSVLTPALRRLDVYVLDYLRKRQLLQTAACFQNEAKLAGGQLGALPLRCLTALVLRRP